MWISLPGPCYQALHYVVSLDRRITNLIRSYLRHICVCFQDGGTAANDRMSHVPGNFHRFPSVGVAMISGSSLGWASLTKSYGITGSPYLKLETGGLKLYFAQLPSANCLASLFADVAG